MKGKVHSIQEGDSSAKRMSNSRYTVCSVCINSRRDSRENVVRGPCWCMSIIVRHQLRATHFSCAFLNPSCTSMEDGTFGKRDGSKLDKTTLASVMSGRLEGEYEFRAETRAGIIFYIFDATVP